MNTSRLLIAAVCHAAAALCLLAQTAPAPAPANLSEEETVKLDAFTVTAEIGAYAETDSTSATKKTTPLRDVPMSMTVLNHAFIEDLRAQRMGDLYQYITGLSFNDTRVADGFSIRGMSGSSNIKNIQVDGLPGLGSRTSTPASGNIERVEVLKGPAAVLYGYMEPGGLVNIVTKKPQARRRTEIFTSASAYASDISSDTGFATTLDTTGALTRGRKLRYRLIAQYENLDSFRRGMFHRNLYVTPSVMYAWNEGTSLTLGLEYVRERRASDDGLVAPLNRFDLVAPLDTVYQNPEDRETDNGWAYTADFRHAFANNWKLAVQARRLDHNDTRNALRNQGITNNATNPLLSLVTRRHNYQYNERNYETLDANLQGEFQTGAIAHRVLVGATVGWEQNWFDRRSFYTTNLAALSVNVYTPALTAPHPVDLPGTIQDTQQDLRGYYAQIQTALHKKLKVVGSIRHDTQDVSFTQYRPGLADTADSAATVPSYGVVWQPRESLSLYASRAESFHPVANAFSLEDINGVSGKWDPEEAEQTEIGLKFDWPERGLTLSAAAFEIKKSNVLEQTAIPNVNGVNYWVVVGTIKSQGAELELSYRPRPHIQVRAGYAYVDAFVAETLNAAERGAPNRNVPHHSANLWARYNVPSGRLKGLGVGFGGGYQSERVGVTTNTAANQFHMPSFVKLDTALYYPWRNFSLALNVKNLADKRYVPGGGTGSAAGNVRLSPGEPRQVIFSVRTFF